MKIQLATAGIIAVFGLAACETAPPTTNGNRASTNANVATAVNSNSTGANANSLSPITATNSNRTTINYNGTAKENEASRNSVEEQAKAAGGTIGQGAEDWWLWSKTNAALTTSSTLQSTAGMNVDVVNSVITLRGTVPRQVDITEANKIAKGISGQKGVSNKLTVNAGGATNSNANNTPVKKG